LHASKKIQKGTDQRSIERSFPRSWLTKERRRRRKRIESRISK